MCVDARAKTKFFSLWWPPYNIRNFLEKPYIKKDKKNPIKMERFLQNFIRVFQNFREEEMCGSVSSAHKFFSLACACTKVHPSSQQIQ